MRVSAGTVWPVVLACVVVGGAPTWAGAGRVKVGEVKAFTAETPHPYPKGWSDTVFSPGAEFIRVHFTGLSLADGDFVTVANPDRSQVWTYTGRGPQGDGDVWSFAIDGDTAVVELHGSRGGGFGYRIREVGHGTIHLDRRTPQPLPEVLCGTDGLEDVSCHAADLDGLQQPVARLLFTSGGSQYLCTGWLVAGSNASTLITNNHCFSTQAEVATLQAMFNYQRTACGGATNAATSSYAGGTLLKTNSVSRKGKRGGLDYTLCTLQGNPEAAWGELTATTRTAAVGDLIQIIQHPGGQEKQVGWWEDAARTQRCAVAAVEKTYDQAATGSQLAYGCDSQGGSSGSPVVDAGAAHHVIALHHFGGVGSNTCLNSGTALSRICADAAPLLSCAGN